MDNVFARVKEAAAGQPKAIFARYGIKHHRGDVELSGEWTTGFLCPWCTDKSGSCSFSRALFAKCHQCGKKADLFDWVADLAHCSVWDACKQLAELLNLPWEEKKGRKVVSGHAMPKRMLEEVLTVAQHDLWEHNDAEPARKILRDRGIDDPRTLHDLGVGWIKGWIVFARRDESGKLTLEAPFAELVEATELTREEAAEAPSIQSAYPCLSELVGQEESRVSADDESLALRLLAEAEQPPDTGGFSRYIFSVSEFLSWAASPHESSLPGSGSWMENEISRSEREGEYAPAGDSGEAARQLGVLVHELLAAVCERLRNASPEDLVSRALSEEFLAKWLPEREEAVKLGEAQLEPMLDCFARSDIFSALKRAQKAHPEFGFLLRRGDSLFRGRIDLLLACDAEVILADFKSDRLPDESAVEDAAAHYRDQLLF